MQEVQERKTKYITRRIDAKVVDEVERYKIGKYKSSELAYEDLLKEGLKAKGVDISSI